MARAVEQSHRIAEVAIGALKQLSLAATPKNIEVWYAHVEGRNPALSRDIQKTLELKGAITQQRADELYDLYILRTDLSSDVIELVARFETEINQLSDVIEASGENTHAHTERLQSVSANLKQSAKDNPAVGALLESEITITKSIREENQNLEKRLAESSDEVATLRHSVESIQLEAMLDPLTGIKNRKTFDKAIAAQVTNAKTTGEELALVLADIDFFKSFNDQWGHQTGDQVLRLVAEVMNANVKGQDLLARYGGEEFAVILPNTKTMDAHNLLNKIRAKFANADIPVPASEFSHVNATVSIGLSCIKAPEDMHGFIARVDQNLYKAKEAGRNKVITDGLLA